MMSSLVTAMARTLAFAGLVGGVMTVPVWAQAPGAAQTQTPPTAAATPLPSAGFAKRLAPANFRVDSTKGGFALQATLTGSYEPKPGVLVVKVTDGKIIATHPTIVEDLVGVRALLLEWPAQRKSFQLVAKSELAAGG